MAGNASQPAQYMRLGRMPTNATLREHSSPEVQETSDALKQALNHAHEVLIKADTVFPFTLFPDTVTVDREKITVSHRVFFRVAEVVSINIDDVLNVTADVGPLFGSLKITTRFYDEKKPYAVNYLWRSDALAIKQLMQGYIIAKRKKVDLASMPTEVLRDILSGLGQGDTQSGDS